MRFQGFWGSGSGVDLTAMALDSCEVHYHIGHVAQLSFILPIRVNQTVDTESKSRVVGESHRICPHVGSRKSCNAAAGQDIDEFYLKY